MHPISHTASRRNIVAIISDSLRPDFLHAYGADFIPTPNIDALAVTGMVFDNAITASPVCGPARYSIITGKSVSGHDHWTNLPPRAETETIGSRLMEAGYMTAAVGCVENGHIFHYCNNFDKNRLLDALHKKHPEAQTIYSHRDGDPGHYRYDEEDYYDRWCCDRATDFISAYVHRHAAPSEEFLTGNAPLPENPNAPFFLCCGFLSPHQPYISPREMEGRVDPARIPEVRPLPPRDIPAVEQYRRALSYPPEALNDPESVRETRMRERLSYCEQIAEVDDLVGRIVASLKENGVYENTTIIFCADHGSLLDDCDQLSKGPYPYSPQLFIPLIVANHPGFTGRSAVLCGNIDIGATLLDIAGDHRAFGVSQSLLEMATGRVPERKSIMSEFCDSCKLIVDKQYTFAYYPFTGETALFDRANDPHLTRNLAGLAEYALIERRFLMEVIDWLTLAKGVRIESHDLAPQIRAGIEEKQPKFLDDFVIAYPLGSQQEYDRVRDNGLFADYNEFCRTRPIAAQYGDYRRIVLSSGRNEQD